MHRSNRIHRIAPAFLVAAALAVPATATAVAADGRAPTTHTTAGSNQATVSQPQHIALGPRGTLYVLNDTLRQVRPDGSSTVLLGTGTQPLPNTTTASSRLADEIGPFTEWHGYDQIEVDHQGNVLFTVSGVRGIYVLPRQEGTYYGRLMHPRKVYRIYGGGVSGQDGVEGQKSNGRVGDIVVEPDGNLVITGTQGGRCKRTVVPVASGTFYSKPMEAGHAYQIGSLNRRTCGANSATSNGTSLTAHFYAGHTPYLYVRAWRDGTWFGIPMKAGKSYEVPLARPHQVLGAEVTGVTAQGDVILTTWDSTIIVAATSGKHYGLTMKAGAMRQLPLAGSTQVIGAPHQTLLSAPLLPCTDAPRVTAYSEKPKNLFGHEVPALTETVVDGPAC